MPLTMYQKNPPLATIKNIVAIAAGKGGVGKSSITVNLALALTFRGYSVGILDADIYGPSIRKMLPEEKMPRQKGEVLIPATSSGIRLISMSYFRKENEAAAVRAPIANGIVTQFIKNVAWGELDFLLIDFPPGTGDIQLTLSQQANLTSAIMVTTPQEIALMDVRKASNLFNQVKVPIVGVVENMSYFQNSPNSEKFYLFGKDGGERLAREMGVPLLANIPIDPEICRCGDVGESIFNNAVLSSIGAAAFVSFADNFVKHMYRLEEEAKNCLTSFELIWKEET